MASLFLGKESIPPPGTWMESLGKCPAVQLIKHSRRLPRLHRDVPRAHCYPGRGMRRYQLQVSFPLLRLGVEDGDPGERARYLVRTRLHGDVSRAHWPLVGGMWREHREVPFGLLRLGVEDGDPGGRARYPVRALLTSKSGKRTARQRTSQLTFISPAGFVGTIIGGGSDRFGCDVSPHLEEA
jgi:hypothetical protein